MNFRKVLSLSLLALAILLPDAGAQMVDRHSHSTTLLPDGNIFIAGGVSGAGNTPIVADNAQMYNMVTNNIDAWGSTLAQPRSSHTATLMSDGRILIAGGFNNGTPLNSIEVCNPIARTCAVPAGAPVLSPARGGHTATLLSKGPNNGKVLLCGGQTAAANTNITETCDLFDPVNNTVADAVSMVSSRMGHSAVLLRSGNVFVTGGRRRNAANTAWIYEPMNEMYDVLISSWSPKDNLLQGRIDHSATVLNNGIIMISGGYNSTNTYRCVNDEGEECWTPADAEAWRYTGIGSAAAVQDWGSHGYLDGAELFDQNGGRMVLGENTFGTSPYRVHKHSALLLPDGGWNMHGGYGGIVRTLFEASPNLDDDPAVLIVTVPTATPGQATINSAASNIRIPLEFKFARDVSGRLVNADAYFAKLEDPTAPAIAVENVELFVGNSTATLDGYPVGTLIDDQHEPGDFDSIVTLRVPQGDTESWAVFEPANLSSDGSSDPALNVSAYALTFPAVNPIDSTEPNSPQNITGGSLTGTLGLTLPKIYRGIRGTAAIRSGTITDPAGNYAITIAGAGSVANISVDNPVLPCGDSTCVFQVSVTIPSITGEISNLQEGVTIQANSANLPAGGLLNVTLQFTYTANEIRPADAQPAFSYRRSGAVVREMIFSSALGFTPNANTWKPLNNTDVSPTLAEPVYNHTALLTPAGDSAMIGGRNCEDGVLDPDIPSVPCLTPTFSATEVASIFIPVYKGSGDGSGDWADGSKLNSKRAFHTSTMLFDGQILTCGGSDGVKPLATCELMDPETKAWTPTASMNFARTRHTATLLPNGNVLVAGGATPSSSAVNTAEIFYPASRSWVLTTPMYETRQNHTATLMPDGNVLVAGGATQSTFSATTEVFITSTSYWERHPSWDSAPYRMTEPRAQHTATLLKNGNVLMTGGTNGYAAVLRSEVYNYSGRSFTAGPNLNTHRYGHSATLLRDGRVLVIGGSDNEVAQFTGEIYNGASWTYTQTPGATPVPILLTYNRASHRAVLLPNGKVMVTGGETAGGSQSRSESFDPDFMSFTDQGGTEARSHHTSLITRDNYILNIGGWDGSKYLDTTDMAYFSYSPDAEGLEAETQRNPVISTGTVFFDRGDRLTLQSATTNFHGISEASGGSAGPMNSSHSNPRVYMQQIDNASGFMVDLSTRIYSHYGGIYSTGTWESTLSSITITAPSEIGALPHGWYHVRVAANGQFSSGHTVQVTVPRPTGTTTAPEAEILGTSSITWSWSNVDIASAQGYSVYSASSSIFITTVSFTSPAEYTQTGLRPNTEASIMISAYNLGGYGPLTRSATYYTLAATPSTLTVTSASFERVSLSWEPNNNTPATTYELSMSPDNFADPLAISTPVPFSVNFTSTFTTINQLSANQLYFFRVRASNGAGILTPFNTNQTSTVTVGGVTNLTGTAVSSSAISWSWDEVDGSGIYYEVFDVTAGTQNVVYVGSTSYNYFMQQGLLANTSHTVTVNAAKDLTGFGTVRGPVAVSRSIYSLTVQPLPATPNVFTNVSTGSFTAYWITNGNPEGTLYKLLLSTHSDFVEYSSFSTTGDSLDFTGLLPNERYFVQITALNGAGAEGTPLDLGSKYTLARAPLAVIPVATTMSGVTLGWETADNSSTTIYEVRGTTENFTLSVTTYVPFAALYTQNYVQLTGLLTGTSYYFDVAARNGDGKVTARIQAVPSAFTLAGPQSAPAGSVGGTSDPTVATTITGTLPNGRAVSMYIPAGAFPSPTAIAISSSNLNPCGYLVGGQPITVSVYSQDGAQPQTPVNLTLYYNSAESIAAIDANRNRMVIARYNPVSGQCLPLETVIDTGPRTITATLNHFSLFQLIVRNASTSLADVLVYPNPFYTNRGNGFVTIANIPAAAKVRIYTLSGEKVWDGTAGTTGIIIWKGVNKSGELVASGIYLAVIDSSAGKKVLKLAVER